MPARAAAPWGVLAGSVTETRRVAVALGSNLGDRAACLQTAIHDLRAALTGALVSPFYETEPVGVGNQPPFLNAALVGDTLLAPRALLDLLLDVEAAHGRTRPYPGAPRTLDLDLILYDDVVIDEPGLRVPHPRFRERAFVLEPLAAIAPGMRDPVTGRSVAELWRALSSGR